MSLLVWLPMTKDLSDQGLGGCTITNDGTTIDNNGKLGKCCNFNGTTNRIYVGGFGSPKDISIAFWMKRNANTGTRQFLFTAWNGISIELGTTGNIFGKVSISGGEGGSASGGTITTDSGWVHVCYTFEDKVGGKMYINGELKQATASSASINWATTSMNGYIGNYSNINYSGKMNDFRIYDHALSPKEIEILSRGLVCHYPLNGNGRSGDNLLPYTAVNTANRALLATNYSGTWSAMTIETIDGYACYKYPKDKSSTWFATGRWGGYLKANTTYTYSAWIYFTASSSTSFNFSSLGHFQVYNSNSTASDKAHEDVAEARIYEPSTIPANTWTKIRITFTTNSLANSLFQVYPRYNIGANVGDLYFRDMKLEETDHVTPWMPNSADSAYTAMGYNSTTEYDVSGYQYNGTKTGTFVYDTDTPRYSVCTKFDGSNYIVANDLSGEIRTLSAWFKTTKNKSTSQFICASSKDNLCITLYSGCIISYFGNTSGHSTGSKCTLGSEYKENDWNHVVVVYTGAGTRDVYCNGVKLTPTTNDYWGGATGFFIGTRASTGALPFYGYISDIRAYATALSATQVAELYNTAVSVANNGTLMGYELVEG